MISKNPKLMRITINFILLVLCTYGVAQGQQVVPSEALPQALDQFNEAFAEGDPEVLGMFITEDYVHTNGTSKAIGRAAWLGYLARRYDDLQAGRLEILSYEMDEVEIVDLGETAIVTGRVRVSSRTEAGVQNNTYRVTHLWVKDAGRWKRAGFHDGKIN